MTDFWSPGWECANLRIMYWSWVVPQFSAPCGDKGLKLFFFWFGFFFLFSTHPVAWHLMVGPFKAERCRAYSCKCRTAENKLPVLQMVNTNTLVQ